MWIKTQGNVLLNLDQMDFITYNNENTMAYKNSQPFIISDSDVVWKICDNLRRGTTIMEVL